MSAIAHEVASQPDIWRRAADLAPDLPLPARGLRLAVAGCGTSLYMAQSYAVAREQAGAGETDAFAASEFPTGRSYDALLVISRSGTTSEVLELLRSHRGAPTVALTAVPDSPVAERADTVISLPFADERSVVQTRFASTALVLLLTHAGLDLSPSIEAARRVLEAPLPIDPAEFRRFQFLGRGWTNGLASEAALKLREAAQAWAEAYPAMEYRHGPISLADPEHGGDRDRPDRCDAGHRHSRHRRHPGRPRPIPPGHAGAGAPAGNQARGDPRPRSRPAP